ncbi:MAG: tetratricopeptide repeat protein [Bacteroidetes bacterium]|nr:tetratricopeptide repeat protein [Bacteroidota bacterium]
MKKLYLCILVISTLIFTSCKTTTKTTAGAAKVSGASSKKELSEKERIDFDYLFFNANKELMLGNFELATNLFLQCIKLDPTNATPMYELAKIYSYAGNKDKALELSGKAANIDQKNIWYQLLYADGLMAKKQYSQAIEIYQRIIKINPDRIDMYFELAETYMLANKPQEAIKVYDRIEEKTGITEEASIQKVRIYTQLKNTEKAVKELNKLIRLNPREPKYYGMLGEIYQNTGQKDKAMQTYNDLLKVDPENPYVHLSIAQHYFEAKQDAKGFEEYKLAFRNPKLDIDTKIKILLSYYAISENKPAVKDDALQLCKALIEAHPDEAKSYAMYGDFLYRDKKMTEARDAYRMAIARDKTKYAIWSQVLLIDSDLGDFDAMLFDSKQTIELFPAQPLGYFFNGIANIQKKEYKKGVEVLSEGKDYVVDNAPLLSQFYASLGDANHQLKEYKASDEAYEKALELDAKNTYVLNNYAYYLSLRKEKLLRAEEMSKKTVDLEPANNSFLDTYGWILYQMGNYEEAKKWIGKALDNEARGNGVILEHYGDILFKLGETEKAMGYWNDAKQKGGNSEFLDKKIADKKLYE